VRRLQRVGPWLAGLGPGGFVRPACQRARWRCCTHRVIGLLYPRWLQKTYHAGGGWRNRACQVRSWGFEEVGHWTWAQVEDWTVCTYACICGGLVVVGVLVDPPVVGRDWSPVSSNKARGYCCRTPGDHCSVGRSFANSSDFQKSPLRTHRTPSARCMTGHNV
jgi:hypothetical protein